MRNPALPTTARFVILDGVDGCGKSTQAQRLVERLRTETGRPVEHLREPGTTAVGESLRALLLDPEVHLTARAEMLLFLAARQTLLHDRVAPALEAGHWVVCDRGHASTYAYQGVAGGLGAEATLRDCPRLVDGPKPHLELILDLPLEVALQRRGQGGDRIENQGQAYHAKVVEGYRQYAEHVGVARRIDAKGSPEEVEQRIWKEVLHVR